MTSFGKLTNALVHASQETTVTLANLNFDFALIKCEAPAEYKQIGDLLSQKRREAAEDGLVHITARKLGALFGSVIPQVPHLIRAYGQRATEISKMPSANPRASQLYGAFSDYVGADCTTIWATATSGEGVITMHLLACMLARIFDGPKAISIWNELVEQRKEILKREISRVGTSSKLSDAIASRIDIPRDQLASWDASARYVSCCHIFQFSSYMDK